MRITVFNYTFNASTGQITFTDYAATGIELYQIFYIKNTTIDKVLFNPPFLGGTVSGNVLTLNVIPPNMSNSDYLYIYFDDEQTSGGGGGGGGGDVVVTSSVLPTGASTSALQTSILNAIKAQIDISTSVWTDNSGAYYVRRDSVNEGTGAITVSFTDASGTTATPGSGLKPLSSTNYQVLQTIYDATSSGTGYVLADILARIIIINPTPSTPTTSVLWLNLTQNTTINTPTSGTYLQSTEQTTINNITGSISLPTNAAQETGGHLAAIDTKVPSLGQSTMTGSVPVTIANNQSTIPVSISSVPNNVDLSATGTIAALNGSVALQINGISSILVEITGTWSGTIQFQGLEADGSTWVPLNAASGGPTNAYVTTGLTTNSNSRIMLPAGFKSIRATATSWVSGTANIYINASSGVSNVEATQLNAANFNATVISTQLPSSLGAKTTANSMAVNIASDQTLGTLINGVNFFFSTLNSSTAQLTAGSTFTGTIEIVTQYPSISVLLTNDQPITFTIYQYIDAAGSFLAGQPLVYLSTANIGLNFSIPINGNYLKITAQNTGASTTTTFNLNIAYGVIEAATQLGNIPIGLKEINGSVVDSNTGNASSGTQRVVLATNQTTIPIAPQSNVLDITNSGSITTQNLNPSSGTPTAGSFISLAINGQATSLFQVTANTLTSALIFQGTVDGVNWINIFGSESLTGGSQTSTIPAGATGAWEVNCAGFNQVRLSCNNATTGSATIAARASIATGQTVGADIESIGGVVLSLGSQTPSNSLPIVAPTNPINNPTSSSVFLPVKNAPINRFRTTFAAVIASGVDTTYWNLLQTGAGQSVAQSGGNLVINAQTTVNSETIIRSNVSFLDAFLFKWGLIASQRIANNNLYLELVDIIGDSLVCTVTSATTIVVTFPSTFVPSSQNIGQSFNVQAFQGFTGVTAISGRYAVASISGQNVTFTVSGFATGSVNTGTCSVNGWNYHQLLYTGTTATNATYQVQRKGWAGLAQTVTINTTASPGHAAVMTSEDSAASFQDSLQTASTTIANTVRGMFLQSIADETVPLYVQIRVVNGSTAPATNTTYTLSFVGVEDYVPNLVTIANSKPQSLLSPSFAQVFQPTAANLNATVTATNLSTNVTQLAGTAPVTAGVAGTLAVGGNIAIGTARTENPLPVGGVDINNLTRVNLLSVLGQNYVAGPGESITQFSLGTGAAAVTDGTNGKTIFIQPKESDVYVEFSAISTTPTFQLEGSYDNVNFFIIPTARIDNTAISQQFIQTIATPTITPVAGTLWRGKTYGVPILRCHLVAGTTSNTLGTVRVVPTPVESGVTSSPFGLVLANTSESVGTANGQLFQQGVRTLTIPSRGSAKVQLIIDAMTWTGTMSAGIQVVVEGLNDSASTTWNALTLQPLQGGSTVTTITGPATAFGVPWSGVWEADLGANGYNQVRVRLSNVGTGGTNALVLGGIRIIPIISNQGIGTSTKVTYTASVSGIAYTSAANLLIIESGAAKRTTIRKIIWTPGFATAAAYINLTVYRETTAGTGGATQTPSGRQATDTFSGIVRTGATLGTNSATSIVIPAYVPTGVGADIVTYDFTNGGTEPGIIIPIGTANGVGFQMPATTGGSSSGLYVEFTEE